MVEISQEEYQRIKDLKELDIEICDFGHVNILNLGWGAWGKWYCVKHKKVHILCSQLCLPVVRNIIGCELVRKRSGRINELNTKTNKPYYSCSCYGCGKELKGAGHMGIIKNRNNPAFWGISSNYKILCLECIGKEFYERLSFDKKKTWRKYLKRGYE